MSAWEKLVQLSRVGYRGDCQPLADKVGEVDDTLCEVLNSLRDIRLKMGPDEPRETIGEVIETIKEVREMLYNER